MLCEGLTDQFEQFFSTVLLIITFPQQFSLQNWSFNAFVGPFLKQSPYVSLTEKVNNTLSIPLKNYNNLVVCLQKAFQKNLHERSWSLPFSQSCFKQNSLLIDFNSIFDKTIINQISVVVLLVENFVQGALLKELFIGSFISQIALKQIL